MPMATLTLKRRIRYSEIEDGDEMRNEKHNKMQVDISASTE
jgi:hypothetical protein